MSAHIPFACPTCETRYTAKIGAAGKMLDCRKCGTPLRVPTLEELEEQQRAVSLRPKHLLVICPRCLRPLIIASDAAGTEVWCAVGCRPSIAVPELGPYRSEKTAVPSAPENAGATIDEPTGCCISGLIYTALYTVHALTEDKTVTAVVIALAVLFTICVGSAWQYFKNRYDYTIRKLNTLLSIRHRTFQPCDALFDGLVRTIAMEYLAEDDWRVDVAVWVCNEMVLAYRELAEREESSDKRTAYSSMVQKWKDFQKNIIATQHS
ncbi:MAG: hypothetical protein FJ304_06680 [Planctomycetes bacterium]|nr:hypothetical protein [Planctomycetota bacterium]